MTGWEILREIKEGRAKKVKRAGNNTYTFYAANDSRVIKWYPIEISEDWTDEMISLKCADIDFPEKCVSEFLRELLAYDDWEVAEDEESLHQFEEEQEEEEFESPPCPEFVKEIIEDYEMAEMTGEIIKSTNADFEYDLRKLLNIHGLCFTAPDYILAEYLNSCLDTFNKSTKKRDFLKKKFEE